ncbi:MAG: 2-dehydro-3-deoxyphosphogluconate aldolase [Streptosporangiales bacterium]|nr:2-dehydro-3-deoxyphosphogluconate aldolase [Streptosporangiales bacterium]
MSDADAYFERAFANVPVLVILRGYPPDETVALAQRAWDAGVDCVEVPVQTSAAISALRAAAKAAAERGVLIGAGTVVTVEQAQASVEAGAQFTVAPGTDPDVIAASHRAGAPHLPGVATATDIQRAVRAGCRWLKAFPAATLGASWLKNMAGPFHDVEFVATGGVNADNAVTLLDAGARAVALGSAMEKPGELDRALAAVRGR